MWRKIIWGIIIGFVVKGLVMILPIPGLDLHSRQASVVVTDRFGAPLRELYLDEGLSKHWVALSEIPPSYVAMLILSEDKRFYWHPGFDPIAILRAFFQNRRAHRTLSGASTITQQLVKNLRQTTGPRTLSEKCKEAMLAFVVELKYSKKTILEAYINTIYFGYQTQGLKAASYFYFGKMPMALSLAEQATLVLVPRYPSRYNPIDAPAKMTVMARDLLQKAIQNHTIAKDFGVMALQSPIVAMPHFVQFKAPHFMNFLLSQGRLPKQPKITTTLDPAIQDYATIVVQEEIQKLAWANVKNAACLVLDAKTGEILAYVGSQDFFSTENQGRIDGVLAMRQPGSALKPFVYEYAFEHGYSPVTLLPDLPLGYFENGGYFTPKNYSETYQGVVPIRAALANSLNAPMLYLASQLSLTDMLNRLRTVGFTGLTQTADYYGIGMVLGNGEVSLLSLAQAYLVLANGGKSIPIRALKTAQNQDFIYASQVIDADATAIITTILSDNMARIPSFGRHSSLAQSFPVAVKTGTSTNYRDNWCVGYTPDFVVAVWVGNFDNSAMYSVSGVTGAGPIWHRVMKYVVGQRQSAFEIPKTVVEKAICQDTHLVSGAFCMNTQIDYFTPRMLGGLKSCPLTVHSAMTIAAQRPNASGWQTSASDKPIRIMYPMSGSYFAIDPRIPMGRQHIKLEAMVLGSSQGALLWEVDGKPIVGDEWALQKGRHTITVSGRVAGKSVRDTVVVVVY